MLEPNMGGDDKQGGDENVSISKTGVSLPVGFITRTLFPKGVARAEAIQALSRSATRKLADGLALSAEERAVFQLVMAPTLRKAERAARIIERADEICATEPPLLPSRQADASGPETSETSEEWRERFLEGAGCVSNEGGVELWARILAREGRKPGSFSLRTLSVLRDLSSEDARAFAEAMAVSVRGGGVTWVPSWSYFKSHYEPVLSLTYEIFLRLDAAGLIAMKDSAFGAPGGVDFWFLNGQFRVPADAGTIAVYVLTQAGMEVAEIAEIRSEKQSLLAIGSWSQKQIGTQHKLQLLVRGSADGLGDDLRAWDPDHLDIVDGRIVWTAPREEIDAVPIPAVAPALT